MTMGGKLLNELRTFHYLLVLPIGIFPRGWGSGRKPLSVIYRYMSCLRPNSRSKACVYCVYSNSRNDVPRVA